MLKQIRILTIVGLLSLTACMKKSFTSEAVEGSPELVDCDEPLPSENFEDPDAAKAPEPDLPAPLANPVVDMLIAYTASAEKEAASIGGIERKLREAVDETNAAFAESGANVSVRVVGLLRLAQDDSGSLVNDLRRLAGKRDGLWDEVHAIRDEVKADQVTLVSAFKGKDWRAGRGILNGSFTVVKLSALKQFSLTHELGHNLGAIHDDGFVNKKGGFRTIMAYGSPKRILRFGNPEIDYDGYITGTNRRNEVAKINRNALRVSKFR